MKDTVSSQTAWEFTRNREREIREERKAMDEERISVESTLNERGKRYGAFRDHAQLSQNLKNIAKIYGKATLSPSQQEALDMIFHKIARVLNGDPNYADSWHDIAGYATLVELELAGEIK